ncbi:MAG: hypothetical protein FGM55_14160 [Rhodoferax sp.]|nr:hypothetical protein [Rhodoferax sp.]
MTDSAIEADLQALERISQKLSAALLETEPEALLQAGIDLQQGLQRLLAHPASRWGRLQRQRLDRLGRGLVFQREGLMRRSALVDRQLQHLVPAAVGQSYGASARVYGSVGRSTGQFSRLSA